MDARGKVDPNVVLIERIERHPDSGFRFRDFSVPQWQALREAASNAAKAFPEFRTVGWDVALTPIGPMILEGNWHYDPDGPQITLDRGIKSQVRDLFRT
jgi:Sugar-transfer associated ATP-grasp